VKLFSVTNILTNLTAIDLLERLLKFDPAERITATEALSHPYFTGSISPIPFGVNPSPGSMPPPAYNYSHSHAHQQQQQQQQHSQQYSRVPALPTSMYSTQQDAARLAHAQAQAQAQAAQSQAQAQQAQALAAAQGYGGVSYPPQYTHGGR
jgi:negative regulator of PHO system